MEVVRTVILLFSWIWKSCFKLSNKWKWWLEQFTNVKIQNARIYNSQ